MTANASVIHMFFTTPEGSLESTLVTSAKVRTEVTETRGADKLRFRLIVPVNPGEVPRSLHYGPGSIPDRTRRVCANSP